MEDSSDLENISVVVEDIKSLSTAREARGCSADVGDYDGAEDNDGEFDYNEEVKHRPPTKKAPNDCNKPPSPNGIIVGERTTLVPQVRIFRDWTPDSRNSPQLERRLYVQNLRVRSVRTSSERRLEYKAGTEDIDAKTISAYQMALIEGSCSSNQFKLVTLGAEGAGKTTTISTLFGEEFKPDQKTTVGASVNAGKITHSIASSKWHKIKAIARVAQIPMQRKGELKAQILLSLQPTSQSASMNPVYHQKAVDEVKEILATEDVKVDDVKIIVFDIGGQEVYYDIHFMFLAVEDIALLVFNASLGLHKPISPRAHAEYTKKKIAFRGMKTNLQTIELLLHSVYNRGKKALKDSISPRVPVVLMVGAHAENVSIEDQEKMIAEICHHFFGSSLLEHLPRSKENGFYFIGNSKPDLKVLNHLRSTILNAAQWVISIPRPISYLSFEEKVLNLDEIRIVRAKAVDIAKGLGILEQNVDALLNHYTKKGILLYFPEIPSLKNEIFLKPDEVSDLVCTVITTLDCEPPDTGLLQQSYERYKKHALLEDQLLDFMLSKCKRSKDKQVILGLLEKFSLAAKVPPNTKFSDEKCSSNCEVYMIPSLLVYDQTTNPFPKGNNDIVVVYYFGSRFLPETIFNKLIVRTIYWCYDSQKNGSNIHHGIKCIKRGFGHFRFEKGVWQAFRLQYCQSIHSIKCYITMYHHEGKQPPPHLLQQRQDLLAYLESSIMEISKSCMPSALEPMTFLECPYHEDSDPHILLDIRKKAELVCEILDDAQMIDEKYYAPLYETSAVSHGNGHGTMPGMRMELQQPRMVLGTAVYQHGVNFPPQYSHFGSTGAGALGQPQPIVQPQQLQPPINIPMQQPVGGATHFCPVTAQQNTIKQDALTQQLKSLPDQIMDSTPTNLLQLRRCVASRVEHRWHDIGIQLKFSVEELDQIDQNYQPPSPEKCCREMLYLWKEITVEIKANKLIDAIEEAGYVDFASQLKQDTQNRLLDSAFLESKVVPRIATNWFDIGLCLEIPECKLDCIKLLSNLCKNKCIDMLGRWLKRGTVHTDESLHPTWRNMYNAMIAIDCVSAAEELKEDLMKNSNGI